MLKMRTIMVLLDENGNATMPLGKCYIHTYHKNKKNWQSVEKIGYNFNIEDLYSFKQNMEGLVSYVPEDSIFVAKQVSGKLYQGLDRKGVHIWERDGKPEKFLESIELYDSEEGMKENVDQDYFIEKSRGHYFIDVGTILLNDVNISSKNILKPFFEKANFIDIQILFSHKPPWLDMYLENHHMSYDIIKQYNDSIFILVKSNK